MSTETSAHTDSDGETAPTEASAQEQQHSTRPARAEEAVAPVAGSAQHEIAALPAQAEGLVYPPMPERSPPSRLALILAAVALLLLAAGGVLLFRLGLEQTPGTSIGDVAAKASPVSPSNRPGTVVSTVSLGPGLVETAAQHVEFRQPVATVALTVPQAATSVAGGAFNPRIGNLQILTGRSQPINVSQVVRSGATVTVQLPAPTTTLDVVYAAYGAVVRSVPSTAHRAYALISPLQVVSPQAMTSTRHVNGATIRNLACVRSNGSQTLCGSQTAQGWTVTQGPRQQDVAVVAQVDLSS